MDEKLDVASAMHLKNFTFVITQEEEKNPKNYFIFVVKTFSFPTHSSTSHSHLAVVSSFHLLLEAQQLYQNLTITFNRSTEKRSSTFSNHLYECKLLGFFSSLFLLSYNNNKRLFAFIEIDWQQQTKSQLHRYLCDWLSSFSFYKCDKKGGSSLKYVMFACESWSNVRVLYEHNWHLMSTEIYS